MCRNTENFKKNYSQNCWYFFMLMKEILEVQNGMFHILLPSGFCHIKAQRKEKRCRDVHDVHRHDVQEMHVCAYTRIRVA